MRTSPRTAAVAFGAFMGGVVACSASGPAHATFAGPYVAGSDGPIAQLSFLDDSHYALVGRPPCKGKGDEPCLETGTFTADWDKSVFTLTAGLTGHVTTLPFDVRATSPTDPTLADEPLHFLGDLTTGSGAPIASPTASLSSGTVSTFQGGQQLFERGTELATLCSNPPPGQCSFYDECLDKATPCGPTGYAQAYGDKYCTKYFDHIGSFSPTGQAWITRVGECLQQGLVPYANPDMPSGKTCSELSKLAFAAHTDCYTAPSPAICDLPPSDLVIIVAKIISPADILNLQTAEVGATCIGRILAPPAFYVVEGSRKGTAGEGEPSNGAEELTESERRERVEFWQAFDDGRM